MALNKVNVLLLEDNVNEARLIRELLSAASQYPGDYPWFEIKRTGYLREGLARLAANEAAAAPAVDVVLFNLRLLDSDRWDTFTALQAYAQQTPLIMLTGYAEEAWGLRAVQQGAQDYIPKDDLTGRLLARAILYAIERHRLETKLRQHRDHLEKQVAARTAELEAEVAAHRRAEKHLHKSEQYFRTLAENSPDIIARFDRECRHVYVNATISHYVDLTPQDYIGKTNRELGLPKDRVEQWEHHIRTVFETGKRQVYEFEFEGLQGRAVFSCLLVPEYNERGQVQTVLSVARDVTVRKRTEAALRESETLFRLQFELGNIGITIASPEKAWLHVNQHLCDMLGYSEAELQQTTWESLTHPDDLAADMAQSRRMVAGEIDRYEMDKRFIRKDGTIIYTHLAVSCYRNPDRTLRFTIGSIQDITAHKQAVEQLRTSEANLRGLIDSTQDIMVARDRDFRATVYNEAFVRIIPQLFDMEVQPGIKTLDYLPVDKTKHWIEILNRVLEGERYQEEFEYEVEGQLRYYDLTFNPIIDQGEVVGIAEFNHDITAQKRAEEALRRSEFEKALILSSVNDMVAFYESEDLKITWANRAAAESVGTTVEDLHSRYCYEAWHGRVTPCTDCPVLRVFETHEFHQTETTTPDGRVWALRVHPAHDVQGHFRGVVEVGWDITARKQAEEALRESERKFRTLADNAPDIIARFDTELRHTYVNSVIAQITGIPAPNFIGKTHHELGMPPELAAFWQQHLRTVFETGEPLVYEFDFPTLEGQQYFESYLTPEFIDDGTVGYVLSVTRNITDRKRAEEETAQYATELRRSNEDLQQFATTISHDLQAPLRMVIRFLGLLEEHYCSDLDTEAQEYVDFAVTGAQRMRQLIQDLLQYSRIDSRGQAPAPTATAPLVAHILQMLQFQIADCDAEVTHDPLPEVYADATQVQQLFQNLLDNALKFRQPDVPPRIHIAVERQGDQWQFAVRDNGIGIAPEHHEEVFQVFRRLHTAEEYEGTGVGLAICRKIVERHGGRIWLASAEGQGATFYFTLPVVPEE